MNKELISKDYVVYLIKYYKSMQTWTTQEKVGEIIDKIHKDKCQRFVNWQTYAEKERILSIINFCETVKCLTEEALFDGMILAVERLESVDIKNLERE